MANSNKDQVSFVDTLKDYFKGVRAEWGKITWPEKQQVVGETISVIFIVFVFTMFVLLLDKIFIFAFDIVKDPSIITKFFNN